MLSGRWPFLSGGRHTAWSVLGSMCDGPNGEPDMILPLVPTIELDILNDWAVSGMKASGCNTAQLREEIFVPEHRVLRMKDAVAGELGVPTPRRPGSIQQ